MKPSLMPLSAALALISFAQATHAEEAPPVLPEVVVTATRTEQTADKAMASVTVISREEITRNAALDVGDLLQTYGGLNVVRSGSHGQQTSVFLRGANSNQVLILLDGVRIGTSSLGQPNLQYLRPDNIERIEIVRGPKSSLYGSEAIGGVINIITRKGDETATTLNLMFGNESTNSSLLRQDVKSGKFSGALAVSGFRTSGYEILPSATEESGYRNTGLLAQLGYGDERLGVSASFQQNNGRNEYLDIFSAPPAPLSRNFRNNFTTLTLHGKPVEAWNSKLVYALTHEKAAENQSNDYAVTERTQVDWQNDFTLPARHLVTAGITLASNEADVQSFGSSYDKKLDSTAFYLQDQWSLDALSTLLAVRHEDNDEYGDSTTGEVTLGWRFSDQASVYATLSTGFKAPTLDDLFNPFNAPVNLKAEESENKEVGFKGQSGHWSYGLSVFRNEVDNLIVYNFDPVTFLTVPTNLDKARLTGGELRFGYRAGGLSWNNEYAHVKAEDLQTGEDLSRRPRHTLASQLDYRFSRFQVGGQLVARDHSDNSAFDTIRVPGHAVANLYAGITPAPNVNVTMNVQNVTDKEYGLGYTGGQPYLSQPRLVTLTMNIRL